MIRRLCGAAVAAATALSGLASVALAGNTHWSRQFPEPKRLADMKADTGLSRGNTKPSFEKVKWHDGRLWMAGAWESGIDALTGKAKRNQYWYLWTWSPVEGYQPICWFDQNGGKGPDGKIHDFLFLPDGRMVIGGAFTRLDNLGGNRYHRVNALAIYDPKETSANKWQPLGTFQYNGTVSSGGSILSLAYDPQSNDLFIGGTFGGIRTDIKDSSAFIHRYDFDDGSYYPMTPGFHGAKPAVYKIHVDTSTKPSTIYMGGKWHYLGGDGQNPRAGGTSKYSTGFASWRSDTGWKAYPSNADKGDADEGILQRAGDFMAFDSVRVLDFEMVGSDIYIVGSFSQAKGRDAHPLRGIAKWDAANEVWVDPTGKGGIGREAFSVAKAANGKLYFAGAFGGMKKTGAFFDGFKDGTAARGAISFDPASGEWAQLGGGLKTMAFPEIRLAVGEGNDVWFVGDFEGPWTEGAAPKTSDKPEFSSHMIARWNEDIDFSADPDGSKFRAPAPAPLAEEAPAQPIPGNEHWSRRFVRPGRPNRGESVQNGNTGMDDSQGAPSQITGIEWHGDTLYFAGNWTPTIKERWYVWSYHPEKGWNRLAYDARGDTAGPQSPPAGLRWINDKMYVYGAISSHSGVAVYDPASNSWAPLKGKYKGKDVIGNAVPQKGGPVNDIGYDSKTGDLYLVGSTGLGMKPHSDPPKMVGQIIRVDKDGNYHPMGNALHVENPGKPVLGIYCIYVDETKEPSDLYIGGTWAYYGEAPTHASRMSYNVAKWDHEAKDWRAIGATGDHYFSEHHRKYYPDGLPGLPDHPGEQFQGFLTSFFPRVRDLEMDKQGNLYAVGSLAVAQWSLPPKTRKETFGIAKYDPNTNSWGQVADGFTGFSRDPLQMSWVDDDTMLISGGMDYADDWTPINGVCTLNVRTGEMKTLGGGLVRHGRDQTIAPMVVHTQRGDEWWFGGFFTRAGVNDNSTTAGPVVSQYVAMYDRTKSLDPNAGLELPTLEPLCAVTGYSSKSYSVSLEAKSPDGTQVIWYEKSTSGQFRKKGQGKYRANIRVKAGMTEAKFYAAVKHGDGTEGAPVPVTIPIKPCN